MSTISNVCGMQGQTKVCKWWGEAIPLIQHRMLLFSNARFTYRLGSLGRWVGKNRSDIARAEHNCGPCWIVDHRKVKFFWLCCDCVFWSIAGSLVGCLESGYDDVNQLRKDPDLEFLRQDSRFNGLLERFKLNAKKGFFDDFIKGFNL